MDRSTNWATTTSQVYLVTLTGLKIECWLSFSDSVTLMSAAADLVRNIEPDRLLPPSGKLKREVSMEDIIQVGNYTERKGQDPTL